MRHVRMSVATRVARRLLSLPEPILGRLAGRGRIVRDGRVLNRRLQVLLAVGERTGRAKLRFNVAAARADLKQFARIGMPTITSVHVVDRRIPGPGGELPIRVYRRFGAAATPWAAPPAIVYLHGGGWVTGDLDTHDGTCRLLADVTGCVVVAVDYRLAPEHPFPAAVDDAVAAITHVARHAGDFAIDPARLGVCGDSAGATLAAVTCQALARSDGPRIALQLLICPIMDYGGSTESRREFATGFLVDQATLDHDLLHYLPPGSDARDPRVSPLRARDLEGLPPTSIHTAEFDPLRDEGKAYAERLTRAGMAVSYTCHPGMVHLFYGMAGVIPYARRAFEQIGAEVRAALAGAPPPRVG